MVSLVATRNSFGKTENIDGQPFLDKINAYFTAGQPGAQPLPGGRAGLFIEASPVRYVNEVTAATGGNSVTIEGIGLVYDADSRPIGGTVTSILFTDSIKLTGGPIATRIVNATNLSIDASQLYSGTLGADIVKTIEEAEPVPVFGTEDADVLFGNPEANIIIGLGGDDAIITYENDDVLIGGEGNDSLDGGSGNDQLFGGNGNDQIFAGEGDDVAFGGAGDDLIVGDAEGTFGDDGLFGEEGNDVVYGGFGKDYVSGGNGNDILFGETGNDEILGDEGNDTILGGTGSDRLFGGNGDDVIDGGAGHDLIEGGAGNDLLFAGEGTLGSSLKGGEGNDIIRGGEGRDLLTAGSGFDIVSGGGAVDLFFLNKGSDLNIWQDFENGVDKIVVGSGDPGPKPSFGDLRIFETLDGTGTWIGYEDSQLILEGVDVDLIDEEDFTFV